MKSANRLQLLCLSLVLAACQSTGATGTPPASPTAATPATATRTPELPTRTALPIVTASTATTAAPSAAGPAATLTQATRSAPATASKPTPSPSAPPTFTQPTPTQSSTPGCGPSEVFDPALGACRANTPTAPAATPTVLPVPSPTDTAAPTVTPAGPAENGAAAGLVINDLGDAPDAGRDGRCETAAGNGACTLRAALQEANSGGPSSITFAPGLTGTIALHSALPVLAKGLTLSGPGPGQLTVDAGRNSYRVLTFDSPGDDQAFELSGLTLANGQSTLGGGIYVGQGDSLNLSNCAVLLSQSLDGAGGGLYSAGSRLSLTGCRVGNNAAGTGGGLFVLDGSLKLVNTLVDHNQAAEGDGGGVHFAGEALTLDGGAVSNNSATGYGGGVWTLGTAQLNGVTLEGNSASNGGGAYNRGGIASIGASTVAGNSATNGGGLFNLSGTLLLTNATVSGNSAVQHGGGLYNAATTTLNNTTVAFNSAGYSGGGLYNQSGTISFKNTLLGNQAAGGNCDGAVASLGHNLADDASCQLAGAGDVTGQPLQLEPLAASGGPTATHRLQSSSLAIDAGDDNGCPKVDQRGLPRPQDGPDPDSVAACDAGAVEYTPVVDP